MAIEVERLMAQVEADISKYEKTMAKVGVLFEKQANAVERRNSAMVTKVNKSWDTLGKANKFVGLSSAAGAIAGLTAVGVVTGLSTLVRKSLDAASAIGDTAVQAGVSVEKLQELRFAASQSGASFHDLDPGMMKPNPTLGGFINTGAGPAAVGFKKLPADGVAAWGGRALAERGARPTPRTKPPARGRGFRSTHGRHGDAFRPGRAYLILPSL